MPPPKPIVVVVEDQPELGNVIRDVLGTEGFDVKPVADAGAALQTLREEKVEFLVSDLTGMDGKSADPLQPVAEEFPALPVIVIRDARADDVPFFGPWRAEGTRIFLRRPFRLDDLIAATHEVYG